jgi:hypothetical protein
MWKARFVAAAGHALRKWSQMALCQEVVEVVEDEKWLGRVFWLVV